MFLGVCRPYRVSDLWTLDISVLIRSVDCCCQLSTRTAKLDVIVIARQPEISAGSWQQIIELIPPRPSYRIITGMNVVSPVDGIPQFDSSSLLCRTVPYRTVPYTYTSADLDLGISIWYTDSDICIAECIGDPTDRIVLDGRLAVNRIGMNYMGYREYRQQCYPMIRVYEYTTVTSMTSQRPSGSDDEHSSLYLLTIDDRRPLPCPAHPCRHSGSITRVASTPQCPPAFEEE
jgi:hypothetical protein